MQVGSGAHRLALARGRVTAGGRDYPVPGGMLETAENLRREYGIGRDEQDQLALKLSDMDLIELNEAFAAQVLAVTREWGFGAADFERLNVHGSGISLGHPVGATGTRILTTLAREMHRRQARFGLETMCIGGGQGLAAVFGRVEGQGPGRPRSV
jgi:acetyl-CoA acetyltransferase